MTKTDKLRETYRMTDLPETERPREKLLTYGVKYLSNSELIAIIIRTGNKSESALDIGNKIVSMNNGNLDYLMNIKVEELMEIKGIGLSKACQIIAGLELGKRIASAPKEDEIKVNRPEIIADLFMERMKYEKKEIFEILLLDTKNKIISIEQVSIGNLNSSIVHPREVFNPAIRRSAFSIILVHNHPSGDPSPSREDINITHRLMEAGDMLGIKVLDHIIIGYDNYYSLKQKNMM